MVKLAELFCGAVFGRLTVVRTVKVPCTNRLRLMVEATCSCGKSVTVYIGSIGKATLSCGCLHRELVKKRAKGACVTHGLSKSGTYRSWRCMLERCFNPSNPQYPVYKNRAPSEDWKKFENFYRDMGDKPDGFTIERVDNNLPYSKENCIWASKAQQNRNTSKTVWLTNGKDSYCFSEAARVMGLPKATLRNRVFRYGWPLKKALGPEWDWVDPKVGEAAAAAAAAVKAKKVRA